jgi:AcrR family transcriptional regulator
MTVPRRFGSAQSATRALILDATREIMVEAGYAAVSARRVAAKAGIKPALVQYYFPTMDGLLLALYRHAAENVIERQTEALASAHPLRALWALSIDPARAALGIEFMACANHRKAIAAEIAVYATRTRELQARALEHLLATPPLDAYPPAGLTVVLAGIARALVMEQGVGVNFGHDEARMIIEQWLQRLEPCAP